mgnify:CR=1 FL=1
MKKFLSLIITIVFALGLKAQVTSAPDFKAVDYAGDSIHLYEILEDGQYVLLHFNGKKSDEETAPLVEAYKKLGCNQHEVFFIGVYYNGTPTPAKEYVETFGIEYPLIYNADSPDGSGSVSGPAFDIFMKLFQWPEATLLIAPNKNIVINGLKIETSDDIVSALAPYDIKEYDCGDDNTGDDNTGDDNTGDDNTGDDNTGDDNTGDDNTGDEPQVSDSISVEIGVLDVTPFTIEASFTPNEKCAPYFICLDTLGGLDQWAQIFNVTLETLVETWGRDPRTGNTTNLWKELIPNKDYVIHVLPKDEKGNAGKLQTHTVRTVAIGGEGLSVIDLEVKVVSTTSVRVIATPNEETAEYHYVLFTKSFSDSIGVDSTMKYIYTDPYALYEADNWLWENLLPNTEYYAIAQGKNIKGEWGEITKVEFVTTKPDGIEELSSSFKLYPNPASSEINITSQLNGEADVRIYDMTGRCVKDIHVNDMNNATINISDIDNGLYLININGSFEKLIIE